LSRFPFRAAHVFTALTLATSFWAGAAQASPGVLSIAPLGSTLLVQPGKKDVQEVFNLTNAGSEDTTFEVQVFGWAQDAVGEPVYTPSDEFLVFPKTLTVRPGKTRAVRLMRRTPGSEDPKAQRYFRVQFREIPRRFGEDNQEVQVALVTRILVPLVLQNGEFKGTPALVARQTPEGLRISNPSEALLKVSSLFCGETRVSGLLYVQPGVSALLPRATCAQPLRAVREGAPDTQHEVLVTP